MLEKIEENQLNPVNQCSEETLLYQLVSGLHASINMHISANYFDQDTNTTSANHAMYFSALGKY